MMGRGKDWCLGGFTRRVPLFISSPSHRPWALSFSLSPVSLRYKDVSAKENALIQKEHTCNSISTIRLNSKILGAGIIRARRGSLLSSSRVLLERPVK